MTNLQTLIPHFFCCTVFSFAFFNIPNVKKNRELYKRRKSQTEKLLQLCGIIYASKKFYL